MLAILRRAVAQFSNDECMMLAASLAYYTLFAMPPLLFLLVTVVSLGMSGAYEQDRAETEAREFLQLQAAQLIGNPAAADEIGKIIARSGSEPGAWWKSLLSLGGVLLGATGVMGALQSSLNRVWQVKPSDDTRFAKQFLIKRLLSLAMILGFGFLLFVSFVVGTLLSLVTTYAAGRLGLESIWPQVINQSVSFVTTWAFFALIFRFMPDAKVTWRHALQGGLFTVALFTGGRIVLHYYLTAASPGAELGSAAGSLIVLLVWVYYSSIILLFGAEVTANIGERKPEPENGAVKVPPA